MMENNIAMVWHKTRLYITAWSTTQYLESDAIQKLEEEIEEGG
jgi:hypothetical protein